MHIPGKKGPTCQQPERKFLARGGGKGVGVSRCKKGTYTEKKNTAAGPSVSWAQPALPGHSPALLSGLSLPRAQGFPNSITPGKPAQDWEDRKPHPGAQPSVPGEKAPMVSHNLGPRLGPGQSSDLVIEGSRRNDSDLGGVLGMYGGQGTHSATSSPCHFVPLTRVGVIPDGEPPTRHSPAFGRLKSTVRCRASCPGCSQQFSALPPVCQVTKSPRAPARQSFSSLKQTNKQKNTSLQTSPSQQWPGLGRGCLRQVTLLPQPGQGRPCLLPFGAPTPAQRLHRTVRGLKCPPSTGFSPHSPRKVSFWVPILSVLVSITKFHGTG